MHGFLLETKRSSIITIDVTALHKHQLVSGLTPETLISELNKNIISFDSFSTAAEIPHSKDGLKCGPISTRRPVLTADSCTIHAILSADRKPVLIIF